MKSSSPSSSKPRCCRPAEPAKRRRRSGEEITDRFNGVRPLVKHQMTCVAEGLHLRARNQFRPGLGLLVRQKTVLLAPDQQRGDADPMQPSRKAMTERMLPGDPRDRRHIA